MTSSSLTIRHFSSSLRLDDDDDDDDNDDDGNDDDDNDDDDDENVYKLVLSVSLHMYHENSYPFITHLISSPIGCLSWSRHRDDS